MSEPYEQKIYKFMDVKFEGISPEETKKIWEKPMSESKDKNSLIEDQSFSIKNEHSRYSNLSLKEYAAIHLKVPSSGTPWLDEMIERSLRDEFAKAAMVSLSSKLEAWNIENGDPAFNKKNLKILSKDILILTDFLLAESNKRKEGE